MGIGASWQRSKMGNNLSRCNLSDFDRRSGHHVANDYDEDIYVQVVSDTVSQSIRDNVAANLKNLAVGREHNRQLAARAGFTPIRSKTYLAFAPYAKSTTYITIYTESA